MSTFQKQDEKLQNKDFSNLDKEQNKEDVKRALNEDMKIPFSSNHPQERPPTESVLEKKKDLPESKNEAPSA